MRWSHLITFSTFSRQDGVNPLSPTIDLGRISPYTISMISSRQVIGINLKYQLGDY